MLTLHPSDGGWFVVVYVGVDDDVCGDEIGVSGRRWAGWWSCNEICCYPAEESLPNFLCYSIHYLEELSQLRFLCCSIQMAGELLQVR